VRFAWTDLSKVEIHARSSLHPIHASTSAISGEAAGQVRDGLVVMERDPTGFVELSVSALRSWNPIEDVAMRRAVDAGAFPLLRYELISAEGGPKIFELRGALVMHGVRKEFEADVEVSIAGEWLTVEGEHTFDVRDFGITPPSLLGLRVHPDVRVGARLVGKAAS
jgi:YceI-like domain